MTIYCSVLYVLQILFLEKLKVGKRGIFFAFFFIDFYILLNFRMRNFPSVIYGTYLYNEHKCFKSLQRFKR